MRPVLEKRTPANWEQLTYNRYWMHNDEIYECQAHYSVRDTRYKLIYWYNDDLGNWAPAPMARRRNGNCSIATRTRTN